jgi:hypothetical protein
MSGGSPGKKTRASVEFVISEDEIPALDYAGPRVVGPLNFTVYLAPVNPDWEPIPGGEPKVELYVYATDPDDARQQAETLYASMRKEGGLKVEPEPRFVGVYMNAGTDPLWLQHFDEAGDLIQQRRYELAVVAAQIACEIEIKDAIDLAAEAPEGSLARMAIEGPRSWSLIDKRAQKVFVAVIGRTPTKEPWWSDYRDHVERRNNIVHRGAKVSETSARRSLEVAEALRRMGQETTRQMTTRPLDISGQPSGAPPC